MEIETAAQVKAQVEKLTRCTHAEIQTRVIRKRLAWLEEKFSGTSFPVRLTPRDAFELLFLDYMGLDAHSLAVTAESEDEIVWISRNPCPTLGACAVLGLDTRLVCRAAYEKSTQAFLSRLDPQLRFLRSYQHIRPYADGCQESILRVDFTAMMAAARQAGRSTPDGVVGHGALVALGRSILSQASDAEPLGADPGAHAEASALIQAAQALGDENLSGAILFVSQRPFAACFSLAEQANLTAIVFPSSAPGSQNSRSTGLFEIVEPWRP